MLDAIRELVFVTHRHAKAQTEADPQRTGFSLRSPK
jgi:hypothetical protein